jgi:AP endonuclease 2
LDIMNPLGMFKNGERLQEFDSLKDLLPLSGRLLPEFDRRRSIRDMFTPKSASISNPRSESQSIEAHEHRKTLDKQRITTTYKHHHIYGASTSSPTHSTGSASPTAEKREPQSYNNPQSVKRRKHSSTNLASTRPPSGQSSLTNFFQAKSGASAPNATSVEKNEYCHKVTSGASK